MAQIEIYRVKKTADPEIKDQGMFEFFGNGGPFPKNYIREWAGELPSGNLDMLCGKFFLNPPEGYHGGPLQKSDIAVVDGTPYFLDQESGYKFVEVDFDTSAIKDAVHVEYGRYVSLDEAAPIPRTFAIICESLDIPIGYEGEPGYHGSSKGISDFERSSPNDHARCYLHPQFMKGEKARDFIGLLTQLSQTDFWGEIAGYLRENQPVYMGDLEAAQQRFAPELLLPVELRPMSKAIPVGTDNMEVDYLAAKVMAMDEKQRSVLYAVVEAGWHCGSVAEIINLKENLDCFTLQTEYDTMTSYGEYRMEKDWDVCETVVHRLENSEDPAERALAKYVFMLGRSADEESYGYHTTQEENSAVTQYGVVTQARGIEEKYRSVQGIPASAPAASDQEPESVMLQNADLATLLMEMHAVGGDYMRDASYNVKSLANKGDDFYVMMIAGMIIVTPVDFVFRKDTNEYQTWMQAQKAPDIRSFVMTVTERDDGRITGGLYETDLQALKNYAREFSVNFTHLDAEMKDGTRRVITSEEWSAMDQFDRGQLQSWVKHYSPADEKRLTTVQEALRWMVKENRQPVTVGEFLSQISAPYMAQAVNPQPDMLRVAPEAAKEILAQSAADVFRLMPNDMEPLSPIDAIKVTAYQSFREFAVRRDDWGGIEKWAQKASGEILRQNERGERNKLKTPEH
ncbi:MAG: hypothetical protein FWH17_02725 [Oscillospiraceae bacterium]|nr:hypothetical protein [Oscillospiraceae bacterium]